jgi:TPR repeat protein
MDDPVFASDGHTYERVQIQQWFNLHNTTSPKTRETLTSLVLTSNRGLKTQILEWLENQARGKADHLKLDAFQARIFRVKTTAEALVIIQEMSELVESSKFVLMGPSDVETLNGLLKMKKILNEGLIGALTILSSQCQTEINSMQEKHRAVSTKCVGLELAKVSVNEKQELLKSSVAKLEKKVTATKKKVPVAQKRLDAAQANFDKVEQAAEDAEEEHETAKKALVKQKKLVLDTERLNSEYTNKKDSMERQLESVNGMNEISSSSSSSSSSAVGGSKRRRSSSSSSSSSSSTTRGSKRQKNEKNNMINHPGQWLFEEGFAYWNGLDFKKMNRTRGRLMIEASASAGFPMAVADCHYFGWNGLKKDHKKAFDEFVKIEKDMNGYHWAQHMIGCCYDFGHGTEKDMAKAVEWYTKSAEQGNSVTMNNLGVGYDLGLGVDVDKTKAFELYEQSALLGDSTGMYIVAVCYEIGSGGVTKDIHKAKELYIKAAAQGHPNAQPRLDLLNAA